MITEVQGPFLPTRTDVVRVYCRAMEAHHADWMLWSRTWGRIDWDAPANARVGDGCQPVKPSIWEFDPRTWSRFMARLSRDEWFELIRHRWDQPPDQCGYYLMDLPVRIVRDLGGDGWRLR